jgi:hypothetical protein
MYIQPFLSTWASRKPDADFSDLLPEVCMQASAACQPADS